MIENIIQAAYTAPMDADTVRRMLDQNVLKNPVRAARPGHGRVVEGLRLADRQQGRAAQREHAADRRKPHVPGVITFALVRSPMSMPSSHIPSRLPSAPPVQARRILQ